MKTKALYPHAHPSHRMRRPRPQAASENPDAAMRRLPSCAYGWPAKNARHRQHRLLEGTAMSISLLLLIVLILILVGALPTWGYSRNWGYGPSGGLGLVVVILLILLLMGRI
jgi:hypothetical protein